MDVVTLQAAKAASSPAQSAFSFLSVRKWGCLGDSITNRSSAVAARGFIDQIPKIAGTAYLSGTDYVNAGVPGNTTAQMRARYGTDVRANGIRTLFMLAGTNDIQAGRTLADWSADVKAIAAMAKRDGIPLIIGTVPPRGSTAATTQTRQLTAQYNLWLNTWAPTAGVYVADVWSKLVTSGGNDLLSGYDSGDGIHPETLGHQVIAEQFAAAWANVPKPPLPQFISNGLDPYQLVTNPGTAGSVGAGRPTGWYEQPGGSGTAPTYATAVGTGLIKYGYQCSMAFDATSSGGTRYMAIPMSGSGWAVGDVLLAHAKLTWIDNVGSNNFYNAARTSSPTANIGFRIAKGDFSGMIASPVTNSVVSPGPILFAFTIPSGTTGMTPCLQMTLPTGSNVTATIGEVGLWNCTALGINPG